MVYGSLATAVVALLTLEVAALMLLFAAQVIAEIERFGGDPTPGDFAAGVFFATSEPAGFSPGGAAGS